MAQAWGMEAAAHVETSMSSTTSILLRRRQLVSQQHHYSSTSGINGARRTYQTSTHGRPLHTATYLGAQYSFDTAQFVSRVEREGLSRKQAVGVMEALQEVVEESIRTMTSNLVTRSEQEKHQYTQRVDFQKLKSEITLLEKQDFAELKAENERLLNEVEKLKQRLREEVRNPSHPIVLS